MYRVRRTVAPSRSMPLATAMPRNVPVRLGRLFVGEVGVSMMTQIGGTSNLKAKNGFAWQLRYRTWRDGFRTGLSDVHSNQARPRCDSLLREARAAVACTPARGGRPVCWVRMRPRVTGETWLPAAVEFLRRAL